MASQLEPIHPRKIFDIGCGTGEGIAAIRQRFGCNILSIDENIFCIRRSAGVMRDLGAKVQTLERFRYFDEPSGRHALGIENAPINLSREVMLVQADILLPDNAFREFLFKKAPFDAVTVWLIGAYMGRQSCINLDTLNRKNFGEYRLYAQNRVYELAAQILPKGGVLHIVDRAEVPGTQELRDDVLNGHRAQAASTDLEVQTLSYRPYIEHTRGQGIRMVTTPGTSGRKTETPDVAMISVTSRKM